MTFQMKIMLIPYLAKIKKWIDVSGVADISKEFSNFLTVSRKFGYHCVYVFHVIVPATQIWQKKISQTNIFNIFPASVPHCL